MENTFWKLVLPEVTHEPFEKPVTGNENEPQENSSQVRNYWRDSKTRDRARFFAHQTDVQVEICS